MARRICSDGEALSSIQVNSHQRRIMPYPNYLALREVLSRAHCAKFFLVCKFMCKEIIVGIVYVLLKVADWELFQFLFSYIPYDVFEILVVSNCLLLAFSMC